MSTSSKSIAPSQIRKITATLREQGVTDQVWQQVLLGRGVLSDVAKAAVAGTIPPRSEFRKFLHLTSVHSRRKFSINYDLTPGQMMAAGNYEIDYYITRYAPVLFQGGRSGKEEVEYKLFSWNRTVTCDVAVALIEFADESHPWQLATAEAILAYGAKYSDNKRRRNIAALGAGCKYMGRHHVIVLQSDHRLLDFCIWDGLWIQGAYFLATRPLRPVT